MRFLWCLTILFSSVLLADEPPQLKAGAAAIVINPELGTSLAGYYIDRPADGIHDDLHAKSLVIEQGGVKAAFVVCDLVTMPRGVVDKARALIEQDTAIPADHVMISATHSHTGPTMMIGWTRDFKEGELHDKSERFTNALPGLIARSVHDANAALKPCIANGGFGRVDNVSFNRRYLMKDGSVGWNPGKLNPKIIRPAGPIDPQVQVLAFQSQDDTIATYVNFACHPDTAGGGTKVSADYPGALANILAKVKGDAMVTIFSNGACGDINHVNVATTQPQGGFAETNRIGTILAGETIKTLGSMQTLTDGPIRMRSEKVQLTLPPFTEEELVKARHDATTFSKGNAPMERVKAFKILDTAARQGKPLEVEVQVITLGDDVAWVALPGEMFVNLGLAIKEASPYKHTIIVELANGAIGYIPTRQAYAEGNYEPLSARCAAGSGEILVETAVKLLKEIRITKPEANPSEKTSNPKPRQF